MSGLVNIGLLSAHLLTMNLASAGPLLCIWLGRRGGEHHPKWNPTADRIGQKLAWLSIISMLIGMVLGGGQYYYASSDGIVEAVNRLPSRGLIFAALELGFSLICLGLYATCWSSLRKHRWCHATLALLSGTNLLYHFPPLMSVLGRIASNPTWARDEVLDRAHLLPLMMRIEVIALSTHFFLASLAVAGVTVMWLSSTSLELTENHSARPLARRAAWLTLLTSAMQVPVGVWLLVSLPKSERGAMMGESMIASLTFIGALLLTFILLQKLLTIALGDAQPKELRQAGYLVVILVLLMTATLGGTRTRESPKAKVDAQTKTTVAQTCTTAAGSNRLVSPHVLPASG